MVVIYLFTVTCLWFFLFYILSKKSEDLAEQARREGFDETVRFLVLLEICLQKMSG